MNPDQDQLFVCPDLGLTVCKYNQQITLVDKQLLLRSDVHSLQAGRSTFEVTFYSDVVLLLVSHILTIQSEWSCISFLMHKFCPLQVFFKNMS